MPRFPTLLLTVALAWSAVAGVASAKTVVVDTTIQAAINDSETVDGDTVRIPAGTFAEHVVVTGKSLRLQGAGSATIIRPLAGTDAAITAGAPGRSVVIERLAVQGTGGTATDGVHVSGGTVTLSAITATGFAVGSAVTTAGADPGTARVDVIGSTVTANATGLALGATPGSLRGNRITGNGIGLVASAVDAARNWWGCSGGPLVAGCDTTSGGATTSPHLVLRLRSAFARVPTDGATTELVADVTHDSAGAYAGALFPEDTAVSFGAVLGSLDPASAPLSGAAAVTTLRSGATAGEAAPSATLDQQPVSAQVTFVPPAPPQTVTVTQESTTQTVTVTVPQERASTQPPPPTAPASADGAKLLADARRAIGSKVVRLGRTLLPGIAYVARSVRRGTGTLTIADEDVVPLLVLVCPDKACSAGVSAQVTRTARSGRKAKPYALRRATFDLAAGRQRVVAVRLTRARRQAIKAAKSATMTVTIAVSDPAGNRNRTTMRFVVKVRP